MKIRLLSILLILLLSASCLAACAPKETDEEQPSFSEAAHRETAQSAENQNDPKEEPHSWQASYHPLENRYDLALAAGAIYGCVQDDGRVSIDSINKEGFRLEGNCVLPDASVALGLAADGEGGVYLLESRKEGAVLWRISGDGRAAAEAGIKLEDMEEADDLALRGIQTGPDGYFYLWCEMIVPEMEIMEGRETEIWHDAARIYVKDGQLQTLFYEEIAEMSGTRVLDFQVGADGTPFFLVKDREGIYIQEIDREKKGWGEQKRLSGMADAEAMNSPEHIVSTENGFLYCQGNVLYEFRLDTGKTEKILSLSTYGIDSSDILFLAKNGEAIEIIDNHGEGKNSEFVSLTWGRSEKKTVTLGCVSLSQELEKAVAEFNRTDDEYRVLVMDYYEQTGDWEDANRQMRLDFITDKAPDLISLGSDYHTFAEKGALADLYDFMQEDAECSRSMLVQSVVTACEDDGHLYRVSPAFLLHTMWGYGEVAGGQNGFSFSQLLKLLRDNGKDWSAITGFSADEPVLRRLCSVSMNEFVDWESKICRFDGEFFKAILSFAGEYQENNRGRTYSEKVRDRDVVFSVGMISGVADYQIQNELYGGDLVFTGYPVKEGTGTVASFGIAADLSVNARKEDSTGAWKFVKFYLMHGYDGQGFPIVQEQFDQVMKEAMEDDFAVGLNGRNEREPKGFYGDGVRTVEVFAASQEDVDVIVRLVESVENRFEINAVIWNIIQEESEAYFAGQADLEATAQRIQNRVTLFLQESS